MRARRVRSGRPHSVHGGPKAPNRVLQDMLGRDWAGLHSMFTGQVRIEVSHGAIELTAPERCGDWSAVDSTMFLDSLSGGKVFRSYRLELRLF